VSAAGVERDEALKTVVFESADPEFFTAHYKASRARQYSTKLGPTGYSPWLDFVLRLSKAPVVTVAKVRGRVRRGERVCPGLRSSICQQGKAIFGQPEVGVSLIPGGGVPEEAGNLKGAMTLSSSHNLA
jgi:enoyl-CoA hydratase/carnithine racemase